MEKNVKLVIPARKSAEDGILSIIEYLKNKEIASGKSAKKVTETYLFNGSYALATLIRNFYRDEVYYAVLSVTNTQTNAVVEHACAVLKKKKGKVVVDEVYFDINGKKTLDEMKKFVARSAKASYKNVEVKEGHFYAITNVTTGVANEIERATVGGAATTPVLNIVENKKVKKAVITPFPAKKAAAKPATKTVAKKPATKTTAAKAKPATKATTTKVAVTKAAAKKTTAKPVATKKPVTTKTVAKKPETKTAKVVATKTAAKPAAKKPVAKKATTKTVAKKPATKVKKK